MSIIAKIGWDWANTKAQLSLRSPFGGGSSSLLTTGGRGGGGAIELSVWGPDINDCHIPIPGDPTTIAVGVAHKRGTANATDLWGILRLRSPGGGYIVSLVHRTDGKLEVFRGNSGGTSLGISAATYFDDLNWHHIRMKVVIHPSAGSILVEYDDEEVFDLSGINTEGATGGVRRCYLSGLNQGAVLRNVLFDDFYADDTDLRGDLAISYFPADGDGATTDWVRSGGASDWEAVDEAKANDDTDYLRSTAVGTRSIVTITPGIGAGLVIHSVSPVAVGRTEAGGGDGIKLSMLSGATEDQSAKKSPPATYAGVVGNEAIVDPDTGIGWTSGGLDAAAVVIEHA